MREEILTGGRTCYLYRDSEASDILIQPADVHDLEELDAQVKEIRKQTGNHPFTLAAFMVKDWNRELSPWQAPAVFGTEDFGEGAEETLSFVTEELIPRLEEILQGKKREEAFRWYLGGYSLAGFFSLWAAYRTDRFAGIAAVSPSVWFPGWDEYAQAHADDLRTGKVYLSLGIKEEKTRNRIMARVGDGIRLQHSLLSENPCCETVLEWNPGNHFADSGLRTARGFAWLLGSGA